jgi:hypothetical protein
MSNTDSKKNDGNNKRLVPQDAANPPASSPNNTTQSETHLNDDNTFIFDSKNFDIYREYFRSYISKCEPSPIALRLCLRFEVLEVKIARVGWRKAQVKRREAREALRVKVAEASGAELAAHRRVLEAGQDLLAARHGERRALERENAFWLAALEARARGGGGGCVIL